MANNRYDKIEKCTTGREFAQFARDHDARVRKNGSYLCAENDKGAAYMPDSDRALPKPSRSLIVEAFKLMALAGVLIAAAVWLL